MTEGGDSIEEPDEPQRPDGSRLEMKADSETLDVVLSVPEGEDVERMRGVVASHLDRFAFREAPLTFDWREG